VEISRLPGAIGSRAKQILNREMRVDDVDEVTAAALRARRGDPAAARSFVTATQRDVWRTCANLVDRASADDLTQETYARAFAALHRFAGRSSARTWLLAIARRVCADAIRDVVRSRSVRSPMPHHAADPADAVTLDALLATLPRDRREAFVLTQLVGLSYAEAADVCGCPVGTVRSRVARARADLVASYGDDAGRAASR
jgi:RNA polymerase sigma-70 factor, ECF subfamily